jgi:hypothetical protein
MDTPLGVVEAKSPTSKRNKAADRLLTFFSQSVWNVRTVLFADTWKMWISVFLS